MAKKQNCTYATGKRKTASARVRLFKGKGENLVNGKAISEYFPGPLDKALWSKPFDLTDTFGKYYITVKVAGSGKNGQLKATVHGIARALSEVDLKFRIPLKKAGLLTRDSRERLRRMVGTGGKARRAKQSPKR
jgi:small subunit ribosomal protein S9